MEMKAAMSVQICMQWSLKLLYSSSVARASHSAAVPSSHIEQSSSFYTLPETCSSLFPHQGILFWYYQIPYHHYLIKKSHFVGMTTCLNLKMPPPLHSNGWYNFIIVFLSHNCIYCFIHCSKLSTRQSNIDFLMFKTSYYIRPRNLTDKVWNY